MKYILTSLFILFSLNAHALKVGDEAPAFTLKDGNGKDVSLSDFKGKFVVLEWLNHDCPYVVKHYDTGNMQALQKEYREKDVKWLSIISSAPGKQGFLQGQEVNLITKKKNANPTAVLIDSSGKVGKAYGARTTPHMYIINPEGNLIYMGAIDNKPTTNKDDVKGATNYVREALNAAKNGQPVAVSATRAYGCSVKY